MAEPTTPDQHDETINKIVGVFITQVFSVENMTRNAKFLEGVLTEFLKTAFYVFFRVGTPVAIASMEGLAEAAESTQSQRAKLLASTLRNTFNIDISDADIARLYSSGNSSAVAGKVVKEMIRSFTGGNTSIEPSAAPADRYVNTVLSQQFESWASGASLELLCGVIPALEQVQTVGEIGNRIANALGIGDSSSRVLRPYIDTLVVEPLRRHIDSTYRPTQFSPTEAARHYHAGRLTWAEYSKELAELGYSAKKIEAIATAARKYFTPANVRLLLDSGSWSVTEAIKHLKDQGYDDEGAGTALKFELLQRKERHADQVASAAMAAYVKGDISRVEFQGIVRSAMSNVQEQGFVEELADARRTLAAKRLSPSEARACVRAGILSVRDYREALERDGYTVDAVIALELLLRHELDEKASAEELREQLARERAAEKAARDEARAKRKAEIAEDQALARRGSVASIERAVIRGIAPMARYRELLAPRYDDDTIEVMVELLEQERLEYVEQQERAENARRRAEARGINLSDVRAAVLAKVITIEDYRRRLEAEKIDAGDIGLLVGTLQAQLDDRAEAEQRRAEADRAAKGRRIDLGAMRELVRRGRRSLDDYAAVLATLGFDAGAIAAMRELLELQIADDERAREERRRAEEQLRVKGVSLELMRRGVLLGVKGVDDFERFLGENGFTADAQSILMAELRAALGDVEAARRRRDEADSRRGARELPLSTVARAARLGVVSPDAYEQRLYAMGYAEPDVALEMELLVLEIADTQAARQLRDVANVETAARGLSLAQVERAVKLGQLHSEAYRAKLAEAGYTGNELDTLMGVLFAEMEQLADARRRRDELAAGDEARALSLVQMAAAVKAGERSLEDYFVQARALGYDDADAELLTTLLMHELDAKAGA